MYFAEVSIARIAIYSVIVVVWFFCAFNAAAIARNNGESYGVWLVIGLLTGPFGLAFTAIFFWFTGERRRRLRHGRKERADFLPDIVNCPKCGSSVPSSYERCQFCGARLKRKHRR